MERIPRAGMGCDISIQKGSYMLNETICALRRFPELQFLQNRTNGFYKFPRALPDDMHGKRLHKYLIITVLAFATLITLCVEARAEKILSANEIQTQIIGHSFQGKKGIMSVSLEYAMDGTVTMRSLIGPGKGSWALSGDQLCVTLLSGPRKGKECLPFIRKPAGSFRGSNGLRLILVE
jgi:hypothetical protein